MSEILELVAKATGWLAAGFVAAAALRWSTAGARHALWVAVLAGLAILPWAVAWLPSVALPVLPAAEAVEISLPELARDTWLLAVSVSRSPGPPAASAESWRGVLELLPVAVYLLGVLGVVAHFAAGLRRARRVTRDALPVAPGSGWHRLYEELRPRAVEGSRRPVAILLSRAVSVPFTWGVLRPVTILPADAEHWPRHYRRQALHHELAHVERRDWLIQTFTRLICAVYWFHPLVWIASRRLALEAERASDDRVLLAGASSRDYAEHLLALARQLRPRRPRPLATVSMARQSQLPRRIQAILDTRTRRSTMNRSRLAPYLLPALTLAILLSSAELVPAETGGRFYDPLAGSLIAAVDSGDRELVRKLLDAGARADSAVSGDGNALIAAAGNGDVEMLQLLIGTGADVNSGVSGDGSPLIAAAREGSLEATRLLVDSGADVDLAVAGDENPLIQAAWGGHLEVVRYLIEQGADVNVEVRTDTGETRSPLRMARLDGHDDVVDLLIASGAVD